MSKPKKEPKVYTISEAIYVSYQIVAMSEEDAQEAYRDLPVETWKEMVADAASCNFCDDEVVNDEEYDHQTQDGEYPITEKAKTFLSKNLPES